MNLGSHDPTAEAASGRHPESRKAQSSTGATENEPRKRRREDIRRIERNNPRQGSLRMNLGSDIGKTSGESKNTIQPRSSTGFTEHEPRKRRREDIRRVERHNPRQGSLKLNLGSDIGKTSGQSKGTIQPRSSTGVTENEHRKRHREDIRRVERQNPRQGLPKMNLGTDIGKTSGESKGTILDRGRRK